MASPELHVLGRMLKEVLARSQDGYLLIQECENTWHCTVQVKDQKLCNTCSSIEEAIESVLQILVKTGDSNGNAK